MESDTTSLVPFLSYKQPFESRDSLLHFIGRQFGPREVVRSQTTGAGQRDHELEPSGPCFPAYKMDLNPSLLEETV